MFYNRVEKIEIFIKIVKKKKKKNCPFRNSYFVELFIRTKR